MSKRKPGLSIEEKIVRVESYLLETRQPFTLKELEANLPKAKGVIFQSVQECLDTLVSEGRAHSDKVGVSVLFWNFDDEPGGPKSNNNSSSSTSSSSSSATSTANDLALANADPASCSVSGLETRRRRVDMLERKFSSLSQQIADLQTQLDASVESQQVITLRSQLSNEIARLRAAKLDLAKLVKERSAEMAISPERLEKQYVLLKRVVNAWTDNVTLLEDAAVSRRNMRRDEFRKRFGMPHDFDYV